MKTNPSLNTWYASIIAAGEAKPLKPLEEASVPKVRAETTKQATPITNSQASLELISSSVFD